MVNTTRAENCSPTQLWLGGEVSARRDGDLITRLIQRVRACAGVPTLLIGVDGLASYVSAVRRVFRCPVHTGRRGRPRLVAEAGILVGQVIKRQVRRRPHPRCRPPPDTLWAGRLLLGHHLRTLLQVL